MSDYCTTIGCHREEPHEHEDDLRSRLADAERERDELRKAEGKAATEALAQRTRAMNAEARLAEAVEAMKAASYALSKADPVTARGRLDDALHDPVGTQDTWSLSGDRTDAAILLDAMSAGAYSVGQPGVLKQHGWDRRNVHERFERLRREIRTAAGGDER